MKKLIMCFMVLMLCLGFAGEAEAEPVCLVICPTNAGAGDEVTVRAYDENDEWFDVSTQDFVELCFGPEVGCVDTDQGNLDASSGNIVFTITQDILDSDTLHFWIEPDEVWFSLTDDGGTFDTVAEAVAAGGSCGEEIPGCVGLPSPIVIDPNVMLVYETGETEGDFRVSLLNQPPAGATITITVDPNNGGPSEDITLIGGDPCDGSITLTFNDGNWDQPQTVAFKAIDDNVPDEPELLEKQEILLSSSYPANPEDANFVGEKVVTVDVYDNDQANILFTVTPADSETPKTPILPFPETAVQLWEEPGWRNIGVSLQMPPSGDPVKLQVVVQEAEDQPGGDNLPLTDPVLDPEGPDPNGLYFDAGNYDTEQIIKIWGNDDAELQVDEAEAEGDQNYQAVLVVTVIDGGGDTRYTDMEREVAFNIEDNECGAYGISYLDVGNPNAATDPNYRDDDGNPLPDCYVDIYDVIEFATKWFDCSDPQDAGCESYL
jgi:hypothetical protein